CLPGYQGNNCEENIDECISTPCQNEGVCKDETDGYVCECPKGYSGDHCQLYEDDCVGMSESEKAQRLAAMATQSLSGMTLMIMLGVVIGIFIVLMDISVERLYHLGEELSLLTAHLLILFARVPTLGDVGALCVEGSDPPKLSDTSCRMVSCSLHYLFIIHFAFLLTESLHNYTTWTNVVVGKPLLGRLLILLLCLVPPMIPVGITASAWWTTYTHDHTCWVNYDAMNLYWIGGPIVCMALLTIIISEATGQGEFNDLVGSDPAKRTSAILSSKGSLLIALISMVTWFTGSLAVHLVSLTLYTITATSNIILGVLILFFHTLSNTRARDLLMKVGGRIVCIADCESKFLK
ncbi:MAG: hypothetical protein GY696_24450, partial [Gammaproteobacteria bacterium]|nr:hypothetical protein [Gammaproteobacteria bacterium]